MRRTRDIDRSRGGNTHVVAQRRLLLLYMARRRLVFGAGVLVLVLLLGSPGTGFILCTPLVQPWHTASLIDPNLDGTRLRAANR